MRASSDINSALRERLKGGAPKEPQIFRSIWDVMISLNHHLGFIPHVSSGAGMRESDAFLPGSYEATIPLATLPPFEQTALNDSSYQTVEAFRNRICELYATQIAQLVTAIENILSKPDRQGFAKLLEFAKLPTRKLTHAYHLVTLEYNPLDPEQVILAEFIVMEALYKLKLKLARDGLDSKPLYDTNQGANVLIIPEFAQTTWNSKLPYKVQARTAFNVRYLDDSQFAGMQTDKTKPLMIGLSAHTDGEIEYSAKLSQGLDFLEQLNATLKKRSGREHDAMPLTNYPALVAIIPQFLEADAPAVIELEQNWKTYQRIELGRLDYEAWQSLYMPAGVPEAVCQKIYDLGNGAHAFSMIAAGVLYPKLDGFARGQYAAFERSGKLPPHVLHELILHYIVDRKLDFDQKGNSGAFSSSLQTLLELATLANESGALPETWVNAVYPEELNAEDVAQDLLLELKARFAGLLHIPYFTFISQARQKNQARIDPTLFRLLRSLLDLGYVSSPHDAEVLRPHEKVQFVCSACGSGVNTSMSNCARCGIGSEDFIYRRMKEESS